MRLNARLWISVLVIAFMSSAVAAQDINIGVVNLSKLVSQSPQAQDIRKNMSQQFAARKKALQNKLQNLKKDVQRLKRDGSVMSQSAREELQESIKDQKRLLEIKKSNFQDDVRSAKRKALTKLRKQVSDSIKKFATNNNYDMILGQGVLYANDSINVTNKLLEQLRAKSQAN